MQEGKVSEDFRRKQALCRFTFYQILDRIENSENNGGEDFGGKHVHSGRRERGEFIDRAGMDR